MRGLRTDLDWLAAMTSRFLETKKLDHTTRHNVIIQDLVLMLTRLSQPYKIYNLGAGVKRITTDTETCPCCKQKLRES